MSATLASLATGRTESLFSGDYASHSGEIAEALGGKRILVIGGAGSIGAATLREILRWEPQAVHVVDHNENALAELTRDLRSRSEGLQCADFRTLPVDLAGPSMARLLHDEPPYQMVLNFAALKHVRSEKDQYSLFEMLRTNVLALAQLLRSIDGRGGTEAVFSVSTDKAANPVSAMGASKQLMEQVLLSGAYLERVAARSTSARFANVAFSNGSLLESFLRRLEKRQPLAVPHDVRRFFVSLEEAGQLCLIAACCAPDKHLLVPRVQPDFDLKDLEAIAVAVLRSRGLEARRYESEDEARNAVERDLRENKYPLLVTERDTAGEKPFEEFVGDGEEICSVGFSDLVGIRYSGPGRESVRSSVHKLQELAAAPASPISKRDLMALLEGAVSGMKHIDTGKWLDERM